VADTLQAARDAAEHGWDTARQGSPS
jgi:hypothetical protein